MKDNFIHFLSLTSYLTRADRHYVEGRFLWATQAVDGSCILLWLGIEQIIKTYIVQHRLINGTLQDVVVKNGPSKTVVKYDPQETDSKKIHALFDRTFYNIDPRHDLDRLMEIMANEVHFSLESHKANLEKVKEYYERRYVQPGGTSISLDQIFTIDQVYFLIREKLAPEIQCSLIDEIAYQKHFDFKHPLQHFQYAYRDNRFFKAKKHPQIVFQHPDSRFNITDGVTHKFIDKVPSGIPIHVRYQNG